MFSSLLGMLSSRNTSEGALIGYIGGVFTSISLFLLNQQAVADWMGIRPLFRIGLHANARIDHHHAALGGRVALAGPTGGYGNYTCIQHTSSLSTCYGHQSEISVHVGQSVSKGQVIGHSGNTGHSTGPHLHFEVRINGVAYDPIGYLA